MAAALNSCRLSQFARTIQPEPVDPEERAHHAVLLVAREFVRPATDELPGHAERVSEILVSGAEQADGFVLRHGTETRHTAMFCQANWLSSVPSTLNEISATLSVLLPAQRTGA